MLLRGKNVGDYFLDQIMQYFAPWIFILLNLNNELNYIVFIHFLTGKHCPLF